MTGAFCFLGISAALALHQPGKNQERPGLKELEGAWKLVSIESGGTPKEDGPHWRWVIAGDSVFYGGKELLRLSIEPAAAPKIVDLTLAGTDKTYEGIYALKDGSLKICLNRHSQGVKERPAAFSTKDSDKLRLLIFERDKEGKAGAMKGLTGFVGVALRIDEQKKRITVADILPGSPAQKSGLQKDDIVLKIAGAEATALRPAIDVVRRTRPGSDLLFHVRRNGEERDVTVRVGVLPFRFLIDLD